MAFSASQAGVAKGQSAGVGRPGVDGALPLSHRFLVSSPFHLRDADKPSSLGTTHSVKEGPWVPESLLGRQLSDRSMNLVIETLNSQLWIWGVGLLPRSG